MIDQLLAHRDAIPYTLAVACIALAVAAGYLLGHENPVSVCSEYIVELEERRNEASRLNSELTICRARSAGDRALDCVAICDKRVSKALDDYKEVVCSD